MDAGKSRGIREYAFDTCQDLVTVTIPDSVTKIDMGAFEYCYGLHEIHFKPETPPEIHATTFTGLRYSGDSDYVLPEHHIIITVVLIVFFLITLIATYWRYLQKYFRKRKVAVPSFKSRARSTYQDEVPVYRRPTPEPNYTYRQEHDENDLYSLDPYEYENAVAEYLRDKGYFDVDTTPRSGDYGADVIAKSPNGKKICVQCKRYKEDNRVGVKAVQEIYSAKGYYNCEQAYIFTTSSYTPQAQEMADRLGVVLVVYRNVNP